MMRRAKSRAEKELTLVQVLIEVVVPYIPRMESERAKLVEDLKAMDC